MIQDKDIQYIALNNKAIQAYNRQNRAFHFTLGSDLVIHNLFRLFSRVLRNTAARAKVVEDWSQDGGVLLMGYEMYRLLSLKKSFVAGRKKKSKKAMGPVVIDLDEEDRQQELLKGEWTGGGA